MDTGTKPHVFSLQAGRPQPYLFYYLICIAAGLVSEFPEPASVEAAGGTDLHQCQEGGLRPDGRQSPPAPGTSPERPLGCWAVLRFQADSTGLPPVSADLDSPTA